MRISEHMYQLSGSCYGTNSSIFGLDAGQKLILFDAGFTGYQMEVLQKNLARWHLSGKPITHVFLTHAHMDHAGSAWRFQQNGAKIFVSEADGQLLSQGGLATLDVLFGRPFVCCRPDGFVHEGDVWKFGQAEIEAVSLPGHTAGSMGYLVRVDGLCCFVTGDFVALSLAAPDESAQDILLSAMIRPGFLEKEYGESLQKAAELDVDILLPGHLITYEGDTKKIFRAAYEKYRTQPHEIMDLNKK